jgi:Ca2+/Na+ antiporter
MNSLLFLIFYFSVNIAISFGVGFGLFAIFRVLRYRTDPLSARDMSYLFILLSLALINYALLDNQQYLMLLIAYAFIFALILLLEKGWGFKYQETKEILYEKIELIKPENRELLIRDLEERTGLKITGVEVNDINFLQDTAELKVSYETAEDGR